MRVPKVVGLILDVLHEGFNGFLVAQKVPKALALRFAHLLTDSHLRCRMGRSAAEYACATFSLQCQVPTFLDWYEIILNARKAGTTSSLPVGSAGPE